MSSTINQASLQAATLSVYPPVLSASSSSSSSASPAFSASAASKAATSSKQEAVLHSVTNELFETFGAVRQLPLHKTEELKNGDTLLRYHRQELQFWNKTEHMIMRYSPKNDTGILEYTGDFRFEGLDHPPVPHGKGIAIYRNNMEKTNKDGDTQDLSEVNKTKAVYNGQFRKGYPHGEGVITYPENDIILVEHGERKYRAKRISYAGEFAYGIPHGRGCLIFWTSLIPIERGPGTESRVYEGVSYFRSATKGDVDHGIFSTVCKANALAFDSLQVLTNFGRFLSEHIKPTDRDMIELEAVNTDIEFERLRINPR